MTSQIIAKRMRHLVRVVAIIWLVAVAAVAGGQGASKSAINLTGRWRGYVSDSFGRGDMVWDLVQIGGSIDGEMRSVGTSGAFHGSVRGTLEGSTMSFSIAIIRDQCSITARGTARVTGDVISGTHSGRSCDGPITNGELHLTREMPGGDALRDGSGTPGAAVGG